MSQQPRRIVSGILAAAALATTCRRPEPVERWEPIPIATDAIFDGMWFSDSLTGWIAGGGWSIPGGIVGKTLDGGRSWRFQSGLLGSRSEGFALRGLRFWGSTRGCAAGGGGILLTGDGGESWRRPSRGGGSSAGVFDVQFLDEGRGWAVGRAGISRTEDGGETWSPLVRSAAENGSLSGNAVHFVDSERGWLAGPHGALLQSLDGGRNWTPCELPLRAGERPTFWDVAFVDPEHGWVVGDLGSIFHTENGGRTWQRQEAGVPIVRVLPKGEPPRPREPVPELEMEPDRLSIAAVHFLDRDHGCAVGSYADVAESVVLRTRNGGVQWEVEHVQPGELLRSVFVLDEDHAWAAGDRARTQTQVVLRYIGRKQ